MLWNRGSQSILFWVFCQKSISWKCCNFSSTSNLPNTYNPIANYELSINKRNEVLLEMLRVGYIDEDTYVNTIAEKPTLVQQRDSIIKETYMTTYALHCSTLELMKLNGFEFQYIFDSQDAYEDYIENYNTTYKIHRK